MPGLAQAICQLVPDDSFGWIKDAYALHELKRTREAWKVLFPVAHKFPKEWVISYNLSCYSAQLGNLKAAWKWLERAIDLADSRQVEKMALDDPDLEPLWANIAEI